MFIMPYLLLIWRQIFNEEIEFIISDLMMAIRMQ